MKIIAQNINIYPKTLQKIEKHNSNIKPFFVETLSLDSYNYQTSFQGSFKSFSKATKGIKEIKNKTIIKFFALLEIIKNLFYIKYKEDEKAIKNIGDDKNNVSEEIITQDDLKLLNSFSDIVNSKNLIPYCKKYNFPLEKVINLRDRLSEINNNSNRQTKYTKESIEKILLKNPEVSIRTVALFGEENFIKLATEKNTPLEDLFQIADNNSIDYQPLFEKIQIEPNVMQKEIEEKIKNLKRGYKKNSNNKDFINELNELSKKKQEISHNKINDPKELLDIILIYKTLYTLNKNCLDKVLPYLTSKNIKDQEILKKILAESLYETFRINAKNKEIKKAFDISNTKYLLNFYKADESFITGCQELATILDINFTNDIAETINNLPQNKITKEIFEKSNLDYNKWVSSLEKLETTCSINQKKGKLIHDAIKYLESEFNYIISAKEIPEEEKQKLTKALTDIGFSFKEVASLVYDEYGVCEGKKNITKIFKNNEPLTINTAKDFATVLKIYTQKSSFWQNKNTNYLVEKTKASILTSIENFAIPKIEKALSIKPKPVKISIKKIDMDNIKSSLFLGDDSACCVASDNPNGWVASTYILNKFIQGIEFKKGDNSIGNTMCFIAKVQGKPSLILDNIEIKSEYQYSDELRDSIIDFARKLCKEIGNPKMPIYAGTNKHSLNFEKFPILKNSFIKILGQADDLIYIETLNGETEVLANQFKYTDLIKISN